MNCMAIEQRGDVVLVDCGVTFDDRGLGIDVIHPDFSALHSFGTKLRGVIITHGHEDHIGALPYLLRTFDVPIYGPPYALGLIKERLGEHEVLAHARLHEMKPREAFTLGSFGVEPIRVTHSIADALAISLTTDAGTIVHTGDFKFDDTPVDGEAFDYERLRELGDAGVRLLLSDSTNIDSEGPTGSEADVADALERIIAEAQGAVVVSLFASNVHRLRILGDIARKTNRRIVLLGRGVGTHARVARSTGYLPWPDDFVLRDGMARELPRNRILAIATGSQGEERAALSKLARDENPYFKVVPGDTVILSARTIPGNEPEVYRIIGQLIRRGIDVKTRVTDRGVHVSGHAHRPEQKKMIELVRPKSFIPVHGTMHHLTRHAELARETGVGDVAVIENGRIAEIDERGIALGPAVIAGRVHVFAGRPVAPKTVNERQWMAESGAAFVSLVVDERGRALSCELSIRGVAEDATGEIEEAKAAIVTSLASLSSPDDVAVAEAARLAVRRTFHKLRGSKPMTVVHAKRKLR